VTASYLLVEKREEREEKSLVRQPGTLGGPLKKKKKKEESGPTESYI
jgi:hypothetical protein